MNFTAHRMNTGLSDIFNENLVEKLLKNDSSPQTTNLARINTGIAEMLFGRTETPKGIETSESAYLIIALVFGRTETPKGIETAFALAISTVLRSLEEQKPQRGLKHIDEVIFDD